MAEELDNLSSPPGQLRINSREGGSGCTGLWGGRRRGAVPGVPSSWSGESTASSGEVWGLSRLKCRPSGRRAWETAPLTFHVPTSSSDPALSSGSGVVFGETASQWASLRLTCHCLTGRSDDKKSERRGPRGEDPGSEALIVRVTRQTKQGVCD